MYNIEIKTFRWGKGVLCLSHSSSEKKNWLHRHITNMCGLHKKIYVKKGLICHCLHWARRKSTRQIVFEPTHTMPNWCKQVPASNPLKQWIRSLIKLVGLANGVHWKRQRWDNIWPASILFCIICSQFCKNLYRKFYINRKWTFRLAYLFLSRMNTHLNIHNFIPFVVNISK